MHPDLIKDLIPLVLTQGLAFVVFIWLLNIFAVKPVLELLDERREKIAEQFNEIDAEHKKADALKNEYEEHLRKIEEEARTRMLEEVNKGRRIAEEIAEKARAEAAASLEKARANVEIQVEQAREQLKRDVVDMVMTATEKVLRERVDDDAQRRMVAAFIEEIDGKPAGGAQSN